MAHVSLFLRKRRSTGNRARRWCSHAPVQVPPTVYVNDLPGDEIATEQENDGLRDISRAAVPLQR